MLLYQVLTGLGHLPHLSLGEGEVAGGGEGAGVVGHQLPLLRALP